MSILFISLFFCSFYSSYQPAKFKDIVQNDALLCKLNFSSYESGYSDIKPVVAANVPLFMADFVIENPTTTKLLSKYAEQVITFLNDLTNYGDDKEAKFFCSNKSFPVNFKNNDDGGLVLMINRIVGDDVYNTLKLSSSKRAASCVENILLPILKETKTTFSKLPIKYINLSAVYGCKDFSRDESKAEAEYVSLIIPTTVAAKYISGDITNKELLSKSVIYGSDVTSGNTISKIQILID